MKYHIYIYICIPIMARNSKLSSLPTTQKRGLWGLSLTGRGLNFMASDVEVG